MIIITVVVLVLKLKSQGVREQKPLVIAREIKSAVYVFSFIPFFVHYTHQLISVSYSKEKPLYTIVALLFGIGILMVYLNHFFRMLQGVRDVNYLHSRAVYQQGKVRIE
jgi:hypothetical protein